MPLEANEVTTIDCAGAEKALAVTDLKSNVLFVDPNGASVDLLLPPEADCKGVILTIFNTADAAEVLTVKEDGDSTTHITLAQNESGVVACNGTAWYGGGVGTTT